LTRQVRRYVGRVEPEAAPYSVEGDHALTGQQTHGGGLLSQQSG
jgi:hypothetical protein